MSKSLILFDEPGLEFRYGQRVKDPRDGLALFGPYDADLPSHPSSITYIIFGTEDGLAKFRAWAEAMNYPSVEAPKGNVRLWPPFPGFEVAYCSKMPNQPIWSSPIDRDKLLEASHLHEPHERAFNVVNHYLAGLEKTTKFDEKIGVAICIVPDEVWQNCRPESRVASPIGQRLSRKTLRSRKAGQLNIFESFNPEVYTLSTDFRRQLKARSMKYGIPIQIIRESTLRLNNENKFGERKLTPMSDRMWNIGTTIYYKCGGKPWRLITARDGVCYIGIAFRRTEKSSGGKTATCAAQMFLNTGDGVVFLGEEGIRYSPKTRQYHLSRNGAKSLLEGILRTYNDLEGKPLSEVFLHSRSDISDDEFSGYQEACPSGVTLVGIRVKPYKQRGPRLYRLGNMPTLRGTLWRINEKAGLLWGSGFKPRIATYDGWESPSPLRIDIQHGDATIERVAQDIFGLTKLNYNACRLGDAQPVTVGFSDAVGEILVSNPRIPDRKPNFKFYI